MLVPEADDDFDYAIIDFIGAIVKPNLTRFNVVFGHAGDEKALALLERESFRGRSFEIDVSPFSIPRITLFAFLAPYKGRNHFVQFIDPR